MATENPKISAYVPQIIYDRFKEFKEERNLSFSQAAIELFAEYFGINLIDNSIKEYPGGLPDRLTQLENLVADLKQSYVYLSDKVDSMQSTSSPSKNKLSNRVISSQGRLLESLPDSSVFSNSVNFASVNESSLSSAPLNFASLPENNISSSSVNLSVFSESRNTSSLDDRPVDDLVDELPSEIKGEPLAQINLIELKNTLPNASSPLSKQESGLPNLFPNQLDMGDSSSLSSSLLNNSEIKIKQSVLAKRFKTTEGYIQNTRSRYTTDEFIEWTAKKDPDKISWQLLKEGKKVYYSPAIDLNDEQKASLQKWLSENQVL